MKRRTRVTHGVAATGHQDPWSAGGRLMRFLVLLALVGAGLGAPARPAVAAPASWEAAVDELASPDPSVRTQAAKRLGAAWPEGTLAAPVLVDVASGDGDSGVRREAAKAIEALGASALPVWVRLLEGAKGGAPETFHEVAEEFVRLGPKCSTTDFSAALLYAIEDAPSDAAQAAVLLAVPLLVAPGDVPRRPALLALDLVLADRVRLGGPEARDVAAAGLALYASAALRDRGTHALGASAMPSTSPAALFALLEHQTPHVAVSACAVLGALGGASADVVKALTPSSATPDETTTARMAALGRLGPAARTAVPVLRQLAREAPAGALAALVKLGERTKLLPEEPESVVASLQKASAEPLAATRVHELERFIDAARDLALVDATLAEPARGALWTLVLRRVAAAEYHLSDRAYEALGRLGALDSATDRQLGANAPAKGLQPAIRLRMLAGSDPLGLLAAALDPVNQVAPHDVAFWLPVGVRIGARGAVTPPTFARKDLPESLRLGLLRGYAEAGTPDPARVDQALETLRDGEPETQALASGQFVKHVVGAGRPAPRGEVAREPILRAEMRVAAVDVLWTQGAATAAARPTLEALRTDPDPRVRWRAHRALRAIK